MAADRTDAFVFLVCAILLIVAGAIYTRLRWRRAPRAYRAMIAIASTSALAGAILGAVIVYLISGTSNRQSVPPSTRTPILSSPTTPNRSAGIVVSVTDGDTITVANPSGLPEAIRLTGIDAPEHDQAFGAQSTEHLSQLVAGKTVTLDCENERSYGRMICKVLLPNGEDVCLDQVKAGMAWHYKQYQDEQTPDDHETYAAAECSAMKSKIGLWSDPRPIQPQDFRHGTNSPLLLDTDGCRRSSEPTMGPVVGNARSHIFEWPGCPYYDEISQGNRVPFANPQAAEAAGYRPAHNCP